MEEGSNAEASDVYSGLLERQALSAERKGHVPDPSGDVSQTNGGRPIFVLALARTVKSQRVVYEVAVLAST